MWTIKVYSYFSETRASMSLPLSFMTLKTTRTSNKDYLAEVKSIARNGTYVNLWIL